VPRDALNAGFLRANLLVKEMVGLEVQHAGRLLRIYRRSEEHESRRIDSLKCDGMRFSSLEKLLISNLQIRVGYKKNIDMKGLVN